MDSHLNIGRLYNNIFELVVLPSISGMFYHGQSSIILVDVRQMNIAY